MHPHPTDPRSRRRRRLLQALATGLMAPWLPSFAASPTDAAIGRRRIPASGEMLPLIGVGTSRVFEVGDTPQARSGPREVLGLLRTVGNAMLDTSPMYGTAETVAGDLMAELDARSRLFVATKVWTSGREAGIAQMERSLARLRTDRVDLMQIHNLLDWQTHYATLQQWREQGRIRYVGVTHYHAGAHAQLETVMRAVPLDFVQLNYSLAEPEAAQRLLPLAQERGIAVIVNRPFARGELFAMTRGHDLPGWTAEFDCASWAQFFLKWILGHPAVTVAIPGTGKLRHLQDNLAAARGRLPDAAQRTRMQQWIAAL